jgi:hypothetical protein
VIPLLLSPEVQQFIRDHEYDDESRLILKSKYIHGVDASVIAQQIAGRRKARTKLPAFFQSEGIIYPPSLNLEQSSSEATGMYKAGAVKSWINNASFTLADITGGFGVDSYCFASVANHVTYVEPDEKLLPIVRHNHAQLNRTNITYVHATAEAFVVGGEKFDCLYLDPSRRTAGDRKVFRLQDCQPDVITLLPALFNVAPRVLIKVSPWLDIQQSLRELSAVEKVMVISVDNECRELLFFCKRGFQGEPVIETVNVRKTGEEVFSFRFSEEQSATASFGQVSSFLLEPNASIMKAGAFKLVSERFGLTKLHPHTHLYSGNLIPPHFPGRVFKVQALVKSDPQSAREHFPDGMANILVRNHPTKPQEIMMRLKLKEGGEKYLIACRGPREEKWLFAAERLQ